VTLPGVLKSRWLLALVAGAAAALAHPPFGVVPGLLGWGLLMDLMDWAEAPRPLRSAFWMGWLAALAYFIIGCWWVAEAFLVDAQNQGWMAPFAVILLPAGLGLFWGAAGALYRLIRPGHPLARAAAFASVMSIAEWLRGHVLTGFPWNLPGETWAAGSAMSQGASAVGAYGLTWLTLFAAAGLVAALRVRGQSRARWSTFGAAAAVLAVMMAYGWMRLLAPPLPDAQPLHVRVVQADIDQASKYDDASLRDIVGRYVRLTAMPATQKADVVIWPEGAIPAAFNDYLVPGAWPGQQIAAAVAPGQSLILGGYRYTAAAGGPTLYYNSLAVLQRQGEGLQLTGLYDKYRLVPFGEYLPLEGLMGRLGIKKLVHVGDGFSPGPVPRPITAVGTPAFQPLICYEGLYPGFTRQGVRLAGARPRWIVNISNDAWFGRTSGPWQHLNLASYRAIEEGLPMVRATPTGVSAVIDAKGRSVGPGLLRLGLGKAGVVDAALPPVMRPTLFAAWGEAPFWIMVTLGLCAAAKSLVLQRFNRPLMSGG
jgi:apolipoprotein N-acyltransferase